MVDTLTCWKRCIDDRSPGKTRLEEFAKHFKPPPRVSDVVVTGSVSPWHGLAKEHLGDAFPTHAVAIQNAVASCLADVRKSLISE
eukprot:6358912-Alexandrium_andersonii.AAC.1